MDYSRLFNPELISIDEDFTSQKDVFEKVSKKLNEKGFVKESFKAAIIQREKEYPTGLETKNMNFAIPHTDVVHINEPFIYVVKLKKPLEFIQMGTNGQIIHVDSLFFLGITNPAKQVGLLSLIMEKVQDEQFKQDFNMILSVHEMESFLKNTFRSDEK